MTAINNRLALFSIEHLVKNYLATNDPSIIPQTQRGEAASPASPTTFALNITLNRNAEDLDRWLTINFQL
jgi:hypothetical protein